VENITRYWILDAGLWMVDAGFWMLDARCWILVGAPMVLR